MATKNTVERINSIIKIDNETRSILLNVIDTYIQNYKTDICLNFDIMGTLKQQFITDNQGKNIAVLLPIKEYEKIMDELDEIECVKAYDKAKEGEQEFIPAEQAFKEIEAKRKKK